MTKTALALAMVIFAISADCFATSQWNVNATPCVADAGSIQKNLYLGTGGTIKFATGKSRDIVLYCPISFKLGFTPSIIGLVYYDHFAVPGQHGTVPHIKIARSPGCTYSS